MLTIVISCVITAGMLFMPLPPWTVEKIECARSSLQMTLCMTYPCSEAEEAVQKPRFTMSATVAGAERLDIPMGCTLVSLTPKQEATP